MFVASKRAPSVFFSVENRTHRDATVLWMCLVILTQSVFSSVPQLDLSISELFFREHFHLKDVAGLELFRQALVKIISIPAILALIGTGCAAFGSRFLSFGAKTWGSILAIYIIGPGLIANGLLKRFWGRARPDSITEFGGDAQFTPPGQIADQCATNCSFVSGEASGATASLISVYILTSRLRYSFLKFVIRALGVTVFLAVGTLRIGLGRHFASDVVFAVLITVGVGIASTWTANRNVKHP